MDNGEVILIDDGSGLRAGGFAVGDRIYIQSDSANPVSTAAALYEEVFHQYQGRMLKLEAEVEAKAATAEWVQRNGLTRYLWNDLDASGDAFLRRYLEGGEDALRKMLKDDPFYRQTNMNIKPSGHLYPAPNPYPRR